MDHITFKTRKKIKVRRKQHKTGPLRSPPTFHGTAGARLEEKPPSAGAPSLPRGWPGPGTPSPWDATEEEKLDGGPAARPRPPAQAASASQLKPGWRESPPRRWAGGPLTFPRGPLHLACTPAG